jgi:hypothetical protein
MINVNDFGATGDGVTDDRASMQAALDSAVSGDIVWVPVGRYVTGKGSGFWCLRVPPGVRLLGESRDASVLVQAAGVGGSVRLLQLDGAGATVDTMTLDGQKALQTADEHRAGTFAQAADITVRNVTSQNFTGDGFDFYAGTDRLLLDNCSALGNGRDGIGIIGQSDGGRIVNTIARGNRAQQFDTEPGGGVVSNMTVSGCTIDGAGSTDYAMTIAGGAPAGVLSFARGWLVEDNVINGGIEVVWAKGIRIRRNVVTNPTPKANVTVYRTCDDVIIEDNDLFTGYFPSVMGVIQVEGTAEGGPSRVVVRRNWMTASVFGVFVEGAVSVDIDDNDMIGPGIASASGIGVYIRTTVAVRPLISALVRRNRIRNFGALGLGAYNVGTAKINLLAVTDNVFDDNSSAPTMHSAMYLNDGNGAVLDARVGGNFTLGGCTALLASLPPAGALTEIPTQRWLMP